MFSSDTDHWLDYSTSEDFSRLRHSQNPSRDHNSPSPNSASTLYTPLQALKLDKVWTYIRSLLALPLPKSYSFDLPLSDGINPKSPVYYWETVIPAGVDRYFELRMDHLSNPPVSAMDFSSPPSPSAVSPSSLTKPHLLKSANGVTYNVNLTNPFSLVYVSSVPLYPEDSIMIEDDYVTALNASTTVRFHRSSVHRLVRFLMIVHPGYSFKITISIQHLRSFLRAIYSHITAFPQILFATLFVLMAQQLYHFVKMGGFPRVYNIFRFGKRAVRGGNKLSLRGLGFDSGVSLAVCAWAALAVAVGAGPSDSGYAGLYGWATTYIDNHQHHHHHAHDSLAFDSSDLALNASSNTWQGWSSLLLLWGWELPLIGVSYFVFSALLLTISEGIWHVFFLCSAYLLYFAKRLLCSRAWFARVSQRLLTTGLIAVSVVVLHLFWLAAVGYLPIFDSFSTFPSTSAPFIDKAGYFFFSLRQNRVLSAMLVLHLAGWSAFVFSISSTWFTEAETPSLMRVCSLFCSVLCFFFCSTQN